jgi:GTP-binding protein Era
MPEKKADRFVSGFISILGRPNAGKSTLLNALVGSKIAIVANRPQTTRTLIQGVLTLPGAQMVFVDTPGIHKPDTLFNRRMMETIRSALDERDVLLYLVDAAVPFRDADEEAVRVLSATRTPTLLVLNKIDKVKDKSQLLTLIERYKALHDFAEYIPTDARKDQLGQLRPAIIARLPEGPAYFPADHITDQPERFIAAEMIREKIIAETRQEVPHSVAVMVDQWVESPKLVRISATIYVEREGQKGIIIGAQGALLKRIGTHAREAMELFFGRKIFLELYVKVRPKWRESPEFLDQMDWRSMIGKNE